MVEVHAGSFARSLAALARMICAACSSVPRRGAVALNDVTVDDRGRRQTVFLSG